MNHDKANAEIASLLIRSGVIDRIGDALNLEEVRSAVIATVALVRPLMLNADRVATAELWDEFLAANPNGTVGEFTQWRDAL